MNRSILVAEQGAQGAIGTLQTRAPPTFRRRTKLMDMSIAQILFRSGVHGFVGSDVHVSTIDVEALPRHLALTSTIYQQHRAVLLEWRSSCNDLGRSQNSSNTLTLCVLRFETFAESRRASSLLSLVCCVKSPPSPSCHHHCQSPAPSTTLPGTW